jgi:hypothetical protein
VNIVPVANQREDEQNEGDQEQSSCLGGVDGVAVVLVRRIVLVAGGGHGFYCSADGDEWSSVFGLRFGEWISPGIHRKPGGQDLRPKPADATLSIAYCRARQSQQDRAIWSVRA